jgi:hypothetical protein
MIIRNIILITGLALFLSWYVGDWAYKSQYVEPRKKLGDEIATLTGQIEWGKNRRDSMTQFSMQNIGLYSRSLPRVTNDARSLYGFWLLELLQYSGLEHNNVEVGMPTLTPHWGDYRGTIQCTGTLSQLSYFLFEFYYAPFLHRITSMTLMPMEGNAEKLTVHITVSALALDSRYNPYPATTLLPMGYIQRLATNDLTVYQVIAHRNLLQEAKGGIDKADYTFLTGMPQVGGQTEVWFSVRTDDSQMRAKLGDTIHSGSFSGKIVEIFDQDIVLDRNGSRWLLEIGENLSEAFALPPETGEKNE